jgi:hypothetical protein
MTLVEHVNARIRQAKSAAVTHTWLNERGRSNLKWWQAYLEDYGDQLRNIDVEYLAQGKPLKEPYPADSLLSPASNGIPVPELRSMFVFGAGGGDSWAGVIGAVNLGPRELLIPGNGPGNIVRMRPDGVQSIIEPVLMTSSTLTNNVIQRGKALSYLEPVDAGGPFHVGHFFDCEAWRLFAQQQNECGAGAFFTVIRDYYLGGTSNNHLGYADTNWVFALPDPGTEGGFLHVVDITPPGPRVTTIPVLGGITATNSFQCAVLSQGNSTRPQLRIALEGGLISLRWPVVTNATPFLIEEAQSIDGGGGTLWTRMVPGQFSTKLPSHIMLLGPSSGVRYFRLSTP